MSSTEPPNEPMTKDDSTNDARRSRLVLRKTAEEDFRNKYYEEARKACYDVTKSFADCAKANSMMVVLKCRKENRIMSDCLDLHSSEAGFIKFMERHSYDRVKVDMPGVVFGTQSREFFRKRVSD